MSEFLTILSSQVALTDPHVVNDRAENLNLLQALYEPLVRRAVPYFEPCLAESWSVSEDAKIWEFKLRTGVRFHNGEALQPESVIASIERARSPNVGGVLGTEGLFHSYLRDAELSILNSEVVRLALAEPMADLLDLLADIPILPVRAREQDLVQNPVGSGPYRMERITASEVTMTAHTAHWQRQDLAFPRVKWSAVGEAEVRVARIIQGDADLITSVPLASMTSLQLAKRCHVVTAPSNVCTVFMCNATDGVCADARVRQALNFGFDPELLIETITQGTAHPLSGPLTSKHFGYDSTLQPYPRDLSLASNLLNEAGYGQGLRLVLDVPSVLPDEAFEVANFLSEQYKPLGVETEIVVHEDRAAYAQTVKSKGIHNACCFDSSPISTFRSLREKFRSDLQGPWWLGFEDVQLNRLLVQAQSTVDLQQRESLYKAAYRLLHAQAPWIYLYNQIDCWGVSDRLKSWKPTVHGLVAFS